jgi:Holliday junction resolvase RusA-like endonuclease
MRAGRDGRSGRTFTPKPMAEFQEKVRLCAQAAGLISFLGPVEIIVVAYLSVEPLSSPDAGDWDNYAKNVCDALRGVAFRDDKQIVRGAGVKLRDEQNPRTEVLVKTHGSDRAPPPRAKPVRGTKLRPTPAYTPPQRST